MALLTSGDHLNFTHVGVSVHPLTKALAADWQALQDEWFKAHEKEIRLWLAILTASAKVVIVDDRIDVITDAVSNVLLIETNNDRSAAAYALYFKDKQPSEIKRPVLGKQLAFVRAWVPLLKASPNAALQAFGAQLEQAIADADAAILELAAAKQANHEFRTVGERKAFYDHLNGLRKSTFGTLAKMPHDHPEANLPANFAERFFKRVRHQAEDSVEAMTSVELVALITDKEDELETLRARLKEVLAFEEAEAKRKQERSAMEEELAKEREEMERRKARIVELEKKLAK